jgi:large subunit ribosomal protein L29
MKNKLQLKDLRGNELAELERTLKKLREELFQNKLKHSTNQIENTMLLRNARRNIARICTVIREKSLNVQAAGKEN